MTDTEIPDTETPEAESAIFSCSFCGKSKADVRNLIAGPGGIFICDECVGLCAEIITDDPAELKPTQGQLAAAWSVMLKNRANLARSAEANLERVVRQARTKGLDWSQIAASLEMSSEEAQRRFGSEQ